MSQRIRNRHIAARIPERFASSIVRVIVQQDEITDVLVLRSSGAIEFATTLVHIASMREQQDQALNAHLDQMNRRGFERLNEPACQSQAHDIAIPQLTAPAGHESNEPRLCERL